MGKVVYFPEEISRPRRGRQHVSAYTESAKIIVFPADHHGRDSASRYRRRQARDSVPSDKAEHSQTRRERDALAQAIADVARAKYELDCVNARIDEHLRRHHDDMLARQQATASLTDAQIRLRKADMASKIV